MVNIWKCYSKHSDLLVEGIKWIVNNSILYGATEFRVYTFAE